jgi:hypothetical protein
MPRAASAPSRRWQPRHCGISGFAFIAAIHSGESLLSSSVRLLA